ncbi:MAG: alpha/beta fold hydrolase [Maricaulaceae bacterium]
MQKTKEQIAKDFDCAVLGQGPALVFLHGWPFHQESYRMIVPELSKHFKCYNLNSMGMAHGGKSLIKNKMDFPDHADRVLAFADAMGLEKFNIMGHDTGGTIARFVAAKAPERVEKLVLLNTEMPGHRPPFIPFYQKTMRFPMNRIFFKLALKSKTYRHSSLGFGNVMYNKRLIDGEFDKYFVKYWLVDKHRFNGLVHYLTGLNFNRIDEMDALHRKITAPTQFIWGKNDLTFPCDQGRVMADRMPSCTDFTEIEGACFLPQEEKPKEVVAATLRFLSAA